MKSEYRPLLLFSVLEFFGLFSTLSCRMMEKIVHSFSKESTNSLCTYFPYEGDEDDLSRAFSKISRSLHFAKKTEIVRGIRRRVEIVSHYTSFFYTH